MIDEKEQAIKIANKILDTPYADPDSDESVLARQFLSMVEVVPPTSEQICESLVRHVETTGSEAFSKEFVKDSKVVCSVWVVIGHNADIFYRSTKQWMEDNGFNED